MVMKVVVARAKNNSFSAFAGTYECTQKTSGLFVKHVVKTHTRN